jgi:hypothetical protein
MELKNLIHKSYYGTIGYISSLEDLETLESYILYNLPILKEYKGIIISTNFKSYPQLVVENANLWKKYFPNCILLDSKVNRGHNFGTADLDNLLVDYCKSNNITWLCKSSNDIILNPENLNKKIPEVDFYYLGSIGYGGMIKYNFNFEDIIKNDFFPQTNFYFINTSKIDYLNDKKYLDKTYKETLRIENYNGKVWEYFDGWTCERFLKKCIVRNNLTKYHLISPKSYKTLLKEIKDKQIHDCSHKNIMIEGICHFQHLQEKITLIN